MRWVAGQYGPVLSGRAAHFLFIGSKLTVSHTKIGGADGVLEDLLGPSVEALGFDLIRIKLMTEGARTLQVMAERPDGTMNVDDCAELSRVLSAILDVEDPIGGAYSLEVSSPGIDRPLVRPIDFQRYQGHEAKVKMQAPVDGRRAFRGEILEARQNEAVLSIGGEQVALPFSLIASAKLVLTDKLLQANQEQSSGSADRS